MDSNARLMTDPKAKPVPSPSSDSPPQVTHWFWWLLTHVRRIVIFVIGTTVLLVGVVMIVGPGPATIVIPIGLSILATEFVWARHLLNYAKRRIQELRRTSPPADHPPAKSTNGTGT